MLVTEGFSAVEEVAFSPLEDIAGIEGFDEDLAQELARRAQVYVERRNAEFNDQRLALGVTDEVAAFEAFSAENLVELGQAGVKTLDDLADLASDELRETIPSANLNEDEANDIIMAARAHWFDDEPEPEAEAEGGEDEDPSTAESAPAEAEESQT